MNDSQQQVGTTYFRKIKLPFDLPTPFYSAMLVIWQLSPALQKRFPLHRYKYFDYLCFLSWCIYKGRKQYAILHELPGLDEALGKPIELPELKKDSWSETFSVGLFLIAFARSQYNISAVLFNAGYRKKFSDWYFQRGHKDYFFNNRLDWQDCFINYSVDGFIDQSGIKPHFSEGANHNVFSDKDSNSDVTQLPSFIYKWELSDVFLIYLPAGVLGKLWKGAAFLQKPPTQQQLDILLGKMKLNGYALRSEKQQINYVKLGVNLFGYAKGELGIGEDVRMMALALKRADVAFCVINVSPARNISQKDETISDWLVDEPRYSVNIFCMTGVEHLRFFLENGSAFFEDRYTIGLWPWELPIWPKVWQHTYNLVNEIWAISQYTGGAYEAAEFPVHVLPLALTVEPRSDLYRADFGLPEGAYLYYFAFDFNSTITRKNPMAVIEAFLQAYPDKNDRSVGLVLKVSHVNKRHAEWKKIKRCLAADERIYLVERNFRRPELLAFYNVCDCLVSLHRAEGFGRVIAEAILLEKQVVTSAYSGNMDFCLPERVALVDTEKVKIVEGGYFFSEGQYWAEPDITHAAQLMHEIRDSPRSVKFNQNIMNSYALKQAGNSYRKRLLEIQGS